MDDINETMPDNQQLYMSTELDKIIGDGKVNTSTAMVVFAVELKSQGEKLDSLKQTIDGDTQRYTAQKDFNALEKRVSRVENAIIGVLVFVFLGVLGALITVVIKKP